MDEKTSSLSFFPKSSSPFFLLHLIFPSLLTGAGPGFHVGGSAADAAAIRVEADGRRVERGASLNGMRRHRRRFGRGADAAAAAAAAADAVFDRFGAERKVEQESVGMWAGGAHGRLPFDVGRFRAGGRGTTTLA